MVTSVVSLKAAMPGLEVRVSPELGDPADIETALVWKAPPGELASLPNLKLITNLGAGVDPILADPTIPPHVPVSRLGDPVMAQMMAQLRAQILASDDNSVSLIQFFEACPSRHAMIVAFLAVLEMVKMQAVVLAQEKQFGEIVVKKGKSFDLVFDESGGIRQIDEEYK